MTIEADPQERYRNINTTKRKYPFFSRTLTVLLKIDYVIQDKARYGIIWNMFPDLNEIKLHYKVVKGEYY